MVDIAKGWPLSDEEYEILEEFLAECDERTMTLEEMDGFFCALIAGPEPVPPEEFLPRVFTGSFAQLTDFEDTREIIRLVLRHWNGISDTLAKGEIYMPYLYQEEDGTMPANQWAGGFIEGMNMRHDAWNGLVSDEDHGGAIIPMMVLLHEHDPDPELRPGPITPEKRKELIAYMAVGTFKIYEYFREERQKNAHRMTNVPTQRVPKVGRNEPCPCGSGKKYKKCCGA